MRKCDISGVIIFAKIDLYLYKLMSLEIKAENAPVKYTPFNGYTYVNWLKL